MPISPLLFVSPDDYRFLMLLQGGEVIRQFTDGDDDEDDPHLRVKEGEQWVDLLAARHIHSDSPATLLALGYVQFQDSDYALTEAGQAVCALPPDPEPEAEDAGGRRILLALADGMAVGVKKTFRGIYPPPEQYKDRVKKTHCGLLGGKFWRGMVVPQREWGRLFSARLLERDTAASPYYLDSGAYNDEAVYILTWRGVRRVAKLSAGMPPRPKLVTSNGYTCPACERVFTESDETESGYECGQCGTTYTRDNSADGSSHRCPDCNRFGAKSDSPFCPDCGEPLEETELAKNKAGKWVTRESAEDEQDMLDETKGE